MEELKWYKLELYNKEETYNKIFVSHGGNNENLPAKKREFKLRKAGRSMTTVRQVLKTMGSENEKRFKNSKILE